MKQGKPVLLKEAIFTVLISLFIVLGIFFIHFVSSHFGITEKVMLSIVYVSYVTHVFLYIFEIPIIQILLSLSVELALHRLLHTFPNIDTKSFCFYYSFVAFTLNEAWMVKYMLSSSLSVPEIIICILVTSFPPLTLFYYTGGLMKIVNS